MRWIWVALQTQEALEIYVSKSKENLPFPLIATLRKNLNCHAPQCLGENFVMQRKSFKMPTKLKQNTDKKETKRMHSIPDPIS